MNKLSIFFLLFFSVNFYGYEKSKTVSIERTYLIANNDVILDDTQTLQIAIENVCKNYEESPYIGKWEVPDFDLLKLVIGKINATGKYLSRTHIGDLSLNVLIFNNYKKEEIGRNSSAQDVKVRCVWMNE